MVILKDEEYEELLSKVGTPEFISLYQSFLSTDELKEEFGKAILGELSEEEKREVLEKAGLDIARRLAIPSRMEKLAQNLEEKLDDDNVVESAIKEGFVQGIVKNEIQSKEFKMTEGELSSIVFYSSDKDFLRDCKEHYKEYGIHEAAGENKLIVLNFKEKLKKSQEPKTVKSSNGIWDGLSANFDRKLYVPEEFTEILDAGPLDYTQAEKYAIKVYEGVSPGVGALSGDYIAYKTMNAMLFPGIDNELERIFDDGNDLNPRAIYQPDEIMDISLDLYTAMYKYGQRMPGDREVFRVDRTSSAKAIDESGKTISNLSTSTTGYKPFSKKDISLIHAIVKKGTPCADFKEILGEHDYYYGTEAEILVAPQARVISTGVREPEGDETYITNYNGGPPSAVYDFEIDGIEKAKELTAEEEKDLEAKTQIYRDPERRERAATFMAKLLKLQEMGYDKDQALKVIDQQDMADYIEWKSAFQDVYRYRTRQKMLQIDREVEEAEKTGSKLYTIEFHDMGTRGSEPQQESVFSDNTPTAPIETVSPLNENFSKDTSDWKYNDDELDLSDLIVEDEEPFEIPTVEIDSLAQKREFSKFKKISSDIVEFFKNIKNKTKEMIEDKNKKDTNER